MVTSNSNINPKKNFDDRYNSKGLESIYEFNKIYKSYKGVLREFEPVIFSLKELLNLNEEDFHNLVIIMTEAFNNAVSHGNNYNQDREVEVNILVFPINLDLNKNIISDSLESNCKEIGNKTKVVKITITDEGDGFDMEKIEDPREPKNLLKDGGRGVFLIKELSSSITYNLNQINNKNLNTLQIYFEY